jgi:chaperonin GroEL (HSP60 family)
LNTVIHNRNLRFLGHPLCADLVEEVEVGKGRVVKITGIANKGRTATVLLRGSNKLVCVCV